MHISSQHHKQRTGGDEGAADEVFDGEGLVQHHKGQRKSDDHALQVGAASKVVPIDKLSVVITLALAFVVLHEPFTVKNLIGCALITAGTLFLVLMPELDILKKGEE